MNIMSPSLMNFEKQVVANIEESGESEDLKDIQESSSNKPELELRKPGHVVHPVVRPVVQHPHHVDVPVVRLNVRPKVQVRDLSKCFSERRLLRIFEASVSLFLLSVISYLFCITLLILRFWIILQVMPKRIPGISKNAKAKVPKLLTAHREARPRFSSAVACSPEVQTLVAALRRSWRQTRRIDAVMAKHPRALSPFDITCVLTELQRQHDWQCTLEVIFLFSLL